MNHKWTFLFGDKKLERVCSEIEDANLMDAVKQARWLSIPGDQHYMVNMDLVECIIREGVIEPVEEEFDLPVTEAQLPPIDDQVA